MSHPVDNTQGTDLEPLTPDDAIEMYLTQREGELAASSLSSHESRLSHFARWCETEAIDNMNTLSGRDLHRYRLWRTREGDLKPISIKTQLHTLRVFLEFCAGVNGVHPFLPETIDLPTVDYGDKMSSAVLSDARAETILDHLDTYHYASRKHVVFALLWKTAMRQGTLRAIDVADVSIDDQHITTVHRPETDTPLKNGARGERLVAIGPTLTLLLDDWIHDRRPDVTDEHGREALLATTQSGRVSRSAIRRTSYWLTTPSFVGDGCDCAVDEHEYDGARTCPSSVSPHAIRRGSITAHLRDDVPKPIVSDRCDVSGDVLDRHYNELTEAEKLEQRREHLNDR